ncbi:serine hydrolase domain-containing protein [Nocardia sp. NPDC127606]|uniref:serine hydrolase domain-containing protein n=1 Tax=Nocardia sp. NPDC127606 TaxID=3345406 RepID=UPI0036259AE0
MAWGTTSTATSSGDGGGARTGCPPQDCAGSVDGFGIVFHRTVEYCANTWTRASNIVRGDYLVHQPRGATSNMKFAALRRTVLTATAATILVSTAPAALVAAEPTATPPAQNSCAEPAPDQIAERRDARAAGFDPAALNAAMDFGAAKGAIALQVYRHGCLIGDRTNSWNLPMPLASGTKGVLSVAVGRAITLGYFGLDDPIGRFFPQADPAHAAITVRQILTQTSGLHFSWINDITGYYTDPVQQGLNLPVEHDPGTTFQYAQGVLTLLAEIVEIAGQLDFQDFMQRELMDPLGINRQNWFWLRDRSGNSIASGGLAMRPDDFARYGRLMLQNGTWQGRNLIDPDYVRQAAEPTSANGGYGFLLWTNAGDTHWGSFSGPRARLHERPILPGSPRDTYAFSGALGQLAVVVPSLDMVIVRNGIPTRIDPNNLSANLTGTGNPDNQELIRLITAAVDDVPDVQPDKPLPLRRQHRPVDHRRRRPRLLGRPAECPRHTPRRRPLRARKLQHLDVQRDRCADRCLQLDGRCGQPIRRGRGRARYGPALTPEWVRMQLERNRSNESACPTQPLVVSQ